METSAQLTPWLFLCVPTILPTNTRQNRQNQSLLETSIGGGGALKLVNEESSTQTRQLKPQRLSTMQIKGPGHMQRCKYIQANSNAVEGDVSHSGCTAPLLG